jgi:hypothetical protein
MRAGWEYMVGSYRARNFRSAGDPEIFRTGYVLWANADAQPKRQGARQGIWHDDGVDSSTAAPLLGRLYCCFREQ